MIARLFDHDVTKLIEDDLLGADRATQEAVHEGVGRLTAKYLTEDLAAKLGSETRIRTAVARDGTLDDLLEVIRRDATLGVPPTVVDGGRRYARYPGFRDPSRGLPDAPFDVTTARDWSAKLDATAFSWPTDEHGERVLAITARSPEPDLAALGLDPIAVTAEEIVATTRVTGQDEAGTTVRICFRVRDLLTGSDRSGQRRIVSAHAAMLGLGPVQGASATGAQGVAAVRAPRWRRPASVVRRRGARFYLIGPTKDVSGRLMIAVTPITPGRLIARARRMVRPA